VQTIILPADNRQDVEEDLTAELTEGVTIHYANRIEDVLAVALPLLKARPDAQSVGSEDRLAAPLEPTASVGIA
jgi:ATP-dependent Lon protease